MEKINNEIEYKSVSLDVLLIHFSSNKEWFEKNEKKIFSICKTRFVISICLCVYV